MSNMSACEAEGAADETIASLRKELVATKEELARALTNCARLDSRLKRCSKKRPRSEWETCEACSESFHESCFGVDGNREFCNDCHKFWCADFAPTYALLKTRVSYTYAQKATRDGCLVGS